jgi:dTDP-4-dehydrorhamnose 3,5-epimerase
VRFLETPLAGAYIIEIDRNDDERGFFARVFSEPEFKRMGLTHEFVEHSISYNRHRGTLRGLHYQKNPHGEVKLVRCTRGSVWDVIVDLRPSSSTRGRWYAVELSSTNHRTLYVPKEMAHGFQTLEDDSELYYLISEPYVREAAAGVHWQDSTFGIKWPVLPPVLVSERDKNLPLFK